MGKKNTKTETFTIDLDSPNYVACRDQISKHRSCWKHISAIFHAKRRKITKKDQQEIEKFEYIAPCFLNFPCRERSKRNIKRKNSNHVASKLSKKLDSKAFEDYMTKIWKNFSKDKKHAFTYFDCLWFHNYMKEPYRSKVLSWIKKKHILSKKYIFVPLVCWGHWSLLILCNFGESLQSDSNPPCMLLLDSLEAADPRRVEPEIRKFIFDIYNGEGKLVTKKDVKKIPLWVPQVIMILFLLGFIDSYIFCLNYLLINKNHNGAQNKNKRFHNRGMLMNVVALFCTLSICSWRVFLRISILRALLVLWKKVGLLLLAWTAFAKSFILWKTDAFMLAYDVYMYFNWKGFICVMNYIYLLAILSDEVFSHSTEICALFVCLVLSDTLSI